MTTDLVSLYDKYANYVTCMHNDLDRTGQCLSRDNRVQRLSYEDFCRVWQRWGNTPGLQDTWRREFDLGYDRAVLDLSERLESALFGNNPGVSVLPAREAA